VHDHVTSSGILCASCAQLLAHWEISASRAGALQSTETVPPASRAILAFTVPTPTIVSLRKELGDVWLKAGALGAAMEEFEALQLWEPLVTTYLMAGAQPVAIAALALALHWVGLLSMVTQAFLVGCVCIGERRGASTSLCSLSQGNTKRFEACACTLTVSCACRQGNSCGGAAVGPPGGRAKQREPAVFDGRPHKAGGVVRARVGGVRAEEWPQVRAGHVFLADSVRLPGLLASLLAVVDIIAGNQALGQRLATLPTHASSSSNPTQDMPGCSLRTCL
jgi:hypothetical protein